MAENLVAGDADAAEALRARIPQLRAEIAAAEAASEEIQEQARVLEKARTEAYERLNAIQRSIAILESDS